MIVVLPNTSVNFDTFIGTLTAADPFLPRFATSFATGGCLPSARSAPWREVAFQPYSGDFSERHPSAHLSGVQHDTVVQVDETVPVATGSTTVKGSVPAVARQSVNPEVDHPFFYTIRDNQTGASLFAGVMTNPNAG
jgi:serine protease inhibitor